MNPSYEPKDIEAKWYSFWEKGGYFVADNKKEKPYSIVIPPPNVTGSLHIGHALNNTIQDISSDNDRKEFNFEIEDIDCKINEAFEAEEE